MTEIVYAENMFEAVHVILKTWPRWLMWYGKHNRDGSCDTKNMIDGSYNTKNMTEIVHLIRKHDWDG